MWVHVVQYVYFTCEEGKGTAGTFSPLAMKGRASSAEGRWSGETRWKRKIANVDLSPL